MVRDAIASAMPSLAIEIVPIKTSGDKNPYPLAGGCRRQGALHQGAGAGSGERRVDIAVHSMKDLPAVLPQEFRIVATPPRENPHDALITQSGASLKSLPKGAKLGTSSPRRKFEALRINSGLRSGAAARQRRHAASACAVRRDGCHHPRDRGIEAPRQACGNPSTRNSMSANLFRLGGAGRARDRMPGGRKNLRCRGNRTRGRLVESSADRMRNGGRARVPRLDSCVVRHAGRR